MTFAQKHDDIRLELDETRKQLSAAKELIAVFMLFKFLREDWKVKEAVEKYYAAIGEKVPR